MWEGKVTEELRELFQQYVDKFGPEPDEYEELCYHAMTYDEFVGYIREALRQNRDIVEIIDELEGYTEE